MSQLALYLLGLPRIELDGAPIQLDRRKAIALITYLAMTGENHSRDRLATLFWPDYDQSRARSALRKTLWLLNKTPVGTWLDVRQETLGLHLDANLWVDVVHFRHLLGTSRTHNHRPDEACPACLPALTEAIALYRDDFMAGFSLPDSSDFDEWQFFQSESLRQELASALERLIGYHSAQGKVGCEAAIPYARRWLALDPLHESAHRCLMQLHAQVGQRAAAMRQYEECQRLLAEELGIAPGEATTALYEAIKARKIVDRRSKIVDSKQLSTIYYPPSTLPLPPFLSASSPPVTSAPFVAREQELAELEAALETARSGAGQILFVIGGAGRGKTMLVQAFARQAQAANAELLVVSGYCNAHTGVGDPYLPFREALTLLMGDVEARWAGGLISSEHARRLWEAMSLSIPALVEHAPDLIGSFVPGKALHERAATLASADAPWFDQLAAFTATDQGTKLEQQRIFAQYTAALAAIASQRPILLILEDLQWLDPASTGLLFHLSREVGQSRILIVGTYRPDEVALSWGDIPHPLASILSELKRRHGDIWLDLGRLAPAERRQFVVAYLDTQPNRLGPAFREALFRRTGGHALFTVELLREMQERGDIRQDDHGQWVEGEAINWDSLPAKVEGVIEKRMGRLEEELQAILTVASVEGETFTAEVVARVQQMSEQRLVQRLSRELNQRHRLVMAQSVEWLDQQRLSRYRFRHQLFQHYLYHHLDETERVYLHEAVANVLETLYGEQKEKAAVQLAWHFEQAGLMAKAVEYLLQAGNRAIRLAANVEAMGHLSQALELLATLPDIPQRIRLELGLQLALGSAASVTKSWAAPEAEKAYARALELCRQMEETEQLFPVLWGLHQVYLFQADFQKTLEASDRCMRIAQRAQDPDLLLQAHHAMWGVSFFFGELSSTLMHAEQGIALYDPERHFAHTFLYGHDPGLCCRAIGAYALCLLGYPDQALKLIQETLTMAQERPHPFTLQTTLNNAAYLYQLRREGQTAQERAEAAITISTELEMPAGVAQGTLVRGWALAEQGQVEEGIAQIRQGIAGWQATGMGLRRPEYLGLLAEAYRKAGQLEEGFAVLAEALAAAEKTGERWWEAELYRLKGELLLKDEGGRMKDKDAPEACFLKAIDIARQQRAKWLELRAVMSLSRLWHIQGSADKREEARQILAEIYSWFTEGFDTPDLKEARALLEAMT